MPSVGPDVPGRRQLFISLAAFLIDILVMKLLEPSHFPVKSIRSGNMYIEEN
jgi:hypothetical protein